MGMLRIEEITEAKSGKTWRVKIAGSWYGASKEDIFPSDKGQTLEITTGTTDYGPWVKEVKRTSAPIQGSTPAKQDVDMRWLPMASNTVNAAIAAGIIKEPTSIKAWVLAVKEAIEKTANGDIGF